MVKTKKEILEETIEFYNENPESRGYSDLEGCKYFVSENKLCAVGRCLIDPEGFQIEFGNLAIADLESFSDFWENFKEEYRVEDIFFWQHLQDLHDRGENWNEKGLTKEGEVFADSLMKKYGETRAT